MGETTADREPSAEDRSDPASQPTRRYANSESAPREPACETPGDGGALRVGATIDDFLLVDRLGAGAFAFVFLAHQVSMRRTVALKVTETEDQEAQTLAKLDHPGIVRVYDQRPLPEEGLHLIYMEYVPGGTLLSVVQHARKLPAEQRDGRLLLAVLDETLARRGEQPPADSRLRERLAGATWPEVICLLGAQLAGALDYAHGRGVLHHDVKPGNVLIDATGRAKLADFNVSSTVGPGDGVSTGETLGGSLPYMSPEHFEACSAKAAPDAVSLDGRSDLYALGVVLWELLAGTRPYDDPRSRPTKADLHDALSTLPKDTPGLLRDTLVACLDPDPDERPATGADLARRLAHGLDAEARELLEPARTGWRRAARRFPLAALLLAGLVPNIVLSLLNIAFNLQVTVGGRWDLFQRQVAVVNVVMYAIGIGLGLTWLLGVTRTGDRPWGAIRLGDRLAVLLVVLWGVSGVVFAVWQHAQTGEASVTLYYLFTASLALFGILAATLCFFFVNRIVTSVLLPSRIRPGEVDAEAAGALRHLARRTYLYYAACTAVPFLSVIALALRPGDHRSAFLVLGLLGALGFAATTWLAGVIRRDLYTLARVLDPASSDPAS